MTRSGGEQTGGEQMGGGETGGEQVRQWREADAASWIAVPGESSDKYSRGVLGVVTGSDLYPGAAVLSVEAAARTGVGMIRYLGAPQPSAEVLRRRPETVSAGGRVQAWLIGSGMDAGTRSAADLVRVQTALADDAPLVADAGALDVADSASGLVVITPHYRELAAMLAARGEDSSGSGSVAEIAAEIAASPAAWAERAADSLGVTVLLKGHTTYIAVPAGVRFAVCAGTAWLATAGSGDVLGGILGSLLATHAAEIASGGHEVLAMLAATAAWVHGRAGERASDGAPIVALDIAEAVPSVIRELLRDGSFSSRGRV